MHFKYLIIRNLLTALLTLLFLQGCSNNDSIFSKDNLPLVHRIDIQQGNVIDQNMLAQLKSGMEKKKVLYIMGTPLIKDTFHDDRWDYIYSYKEGRDAREQRRVTLFFKGDKLSHIEGDVQSAQGEIQMEARVMEKVDVPEGEPDTILSKVKKMVTFDDDEPLISDKPDLDDIEVPTTSEASESTGKLDISESEPLEDPIEDTLESEKSGLFDKTWGEEESDSAPPLNDPILTDPALNPSL